VPEKNVFEIIVKFFDTGLCGGRSWVMGVLWFLLNVLAGGAGYLLMLRAGKRLR